MNSRTEEMLSLVAQVAQNDTEDTLRLLQLMAIFTPYKPKEFEQWRDENIRLMKAILS